MKYRLLEVGEVIHEGDEVLIANYYYTQINPAAVGDKLGEQFAPVRREWRMPGPDYAPRSAWMVFYTYKGGNVAIHEKHAWYSHEEAENEVNFAQHKRGDNYEFWAEEVSLQ